MLLVLLCVVKLGLLGVDLLGAWRRRAGEGESGRPGAWQTTLQIPISSNPGFLLGYLSLV
eukprot:973741-Pelagomonas_calceolata.AAC.2